MLVNQIMTKEVITVSPEMSIHNLAELFLEKNISGTPVVDNQGKLIGIVREEGVIFQDKKIHLPTFINISLGFITLGVKRFEEEMKKITAGVVLDIIEKDITILKPEMTIEDAATIMTEKESYYCPVIENEKLVGIVTKRDIVRSIAQA